MSTPTDWDRFPIHLPTLLRARHRPGPLADHALAAPYKVIVIDCDQTLWKESWAKSAPMALRSMHRGDVCKSSWWPSTGRDAAVPVQQEQRS